MEVYIEYILFDNLAIDILIIKILEVLNKRKFNIFNLIVSAILGAVSVVFLPYLHNKFLLFTYKILISIIMVLLLKKYRKIKEYIINFILFYFATFLVGGMVIGFINIMGIEYMMGNMIMYRFDCPIGVLILLPLCVFALIKIMCKLVMRKVKISKSLYNITIYNYGKEYKMLGFLDTGNALKYNGNAVNIISIGAYIKLSEEKLCAESNNGNCGFKDIEYIEVGGIGNYQKFMSFTVDEMMVEDKRFECVRLAVAMKNFDDYDCVLHSEFV